MVVLKTTGYGGLRGANQLITSLKEMGAELVIDVRMKPYCSWNKDFCGSVLKNKLSSAGIDYFWTADLGNLTRDIRNIKLSNEAQGIEKVLSLVNTRNYGTVVLLCAEADEKRCHRLYVKNKLVEALKPNKQSPALHSIAAPARHQTNLAAILGGADYMS